VHFYPVPQGVVINQCYSGAAKAIFRRFADGAI
jgi:hypothetical protein